MNTNIMSYMLNKEYSNAIANNIQKRKNIEILLKLLKVLVIQWMNSVLPVMK